MIDGQRIIEEREATHGSFASTATIAQGLKLVMSAGPNFNRLDHVKIEALECIAIKIARILCGNPCETEHWADVSGYAELVLQDLRRTTTGLQEVREHQQGES